MPASSPDRPEPPLHGVRVLDLTRILVGPYCTQQLADLGADVIKIEQPDTGDDTRRMNPPEQGGEAHFYLAFNRNKRSVALDLKHAQGKEIIHQLAATSQVLIENFRPGVMQRLGLGYDVMSARHPHLVYCSVSAYGQTGLMSSRPGLDPVLQAEMGYMSVTGEIDGDATRHPLSLIDMLTSHHATSAILAAVIAERASGRGQHIDLSLMDGAVASLGNMAQYYLASGEDPPRMGNEHVAACPVGLFHAADGSFYIACGTDRLFGTLCNDVLQHPELVQDPRYATNSERTVNRKSLNRALNDIFGHETREHWLARMRQIGFPGGPVRTIGEALESPEVHERGLVRTLDHPTAGKIRTLGSPLRLSGTPVAEPKPPPRLGEHTVGVLEGLGYNPAQIATLHEERVIGIAPAL